MTSAAIRNIREEIKQYIDHADPKIVKMIHAMLEVDSDADWWHSMPDNVKTDVEEALAQADDGAFISHEQMKKKYPKWFTK
ncbi:hypothetical protein [Taibaiella soli]|uniref:Uncharacterized protein n=1 Tax=Taibaiella soli TaxID=1649169 RepID=A0A2W2AH44_9BACT|nr:hypothetical protein [Taibaiella soli]PZF71540.1 hypothetical protein DN068_15805 [Taibaiella soli]